MELNRIYLRDCLEGMRDLADKSVDLIIADPPYNIGKDKWDKWKRVEDYVEFMTRVFKECERVLKETGSFYWFHNDMNQIRKLMDAIDKETSFVFKQLIVWNKRYNGSPRKYYFDNVIKQESSRMFRQLTEYILFYTFQDETGLMRVKHSLDNFTTLRNYFKEFQQALGLTKKEIIEKVGQRADHCFRWGSSQWDLPTEKTYSDLLKLPRDASFTVRSYESLRQEYESLRYTFNNLKTHHDVWDYDVAPKQGHITPKPVELIENILRHSSHEGDLVLVPFVGSGSECVAAKKLGRRFIGFEIEPRYVEIAERRLSELDEK